MKLKDKVAIVTGSSRGIGAATAILFAKEGAKLVVNYKINKKAAQEVSRKIGKANCLVVQADVSKEEDVKRLVLETLSKFKRIDILVNNAGEIIRPGDWTVNLETWNRTIEVNLNSVWLMIREVAPVMKKQKAGSIVNITSTVGMLGVAPILAYTSAKSALLGLTKAFAKELAPDIRVNAVAPSNVLTGMTRGAGKELEERMKKATPLGRIATADELAKSILFLSCDDSSYITGHILVVDGGYSLK
jgi:NAD(P)-dependent dehydrogenase (short-subunit alcohol dehydrogenase family)